MCGCSANFDGDDNYDGFVNRPKELLVDDADFSGFVNRPKEIVFDNFTSNREKELVVSDDTTLFDFVGDLDGKTEFDSFLGKKAKARRQERRATKKGLKSGTATPDGSTDTDTGAGDDTTKNAYGTGSWFSNNWIYLVIGVAVIGGGYYFYKKRK